MDKGPLSGPPPEEIPLANAPLIRVIAQVRFAPILGIENPGRIAPFQDAIRSAYPILEPEDSVAVPIGVAGGAARAEKTWRFFNTERTWRVSLAQGFLALETTAYASRRDCLDRLDVVMVALEGTVDPEVHLRFGLRYIDRMKEDALGDIENLIRTEMLGVMATPLSPHLQLALSEAVVQLPESEDQLRARWGRVPPNTTVDQRAIEAVAEPTWILDLDMFSERERPFSATSIIEDARRYAERIYCVFRWVVTDAFLERYGEDE